MIWGKTKEQKDQIKKEQLEWHSWFAWKPVVFENEQSAWLCKVKRKNVPCKTRYRDWEEWHYQSLTKPGSIDIDQRIADLNAENERLSSLVKKAVI